MLLLDNGAYSAWRKGIKLDGAYWAGYWTWAHALLDRVDQATAVIPDVIDGSADLNFALIEDARFSREDWDERLMPVWHLDEPLDQLALIVEMGFRQIAFGSSGPFARLGTPHWDERVDSAFAAIARSCEAFDELLPRIHMMRGLGQMPRCRHPFSSADSTNLARNHARQARAGECISTFRARIERFRFPVPSGPLWPHAEIDEKAPRTSNVQLSMFLHNHEDHGVVGTDLTPVEGPSELFSDSPGFSSKRCANTPSFG